MLEFSEFCLCSILTLTMSEEGENVDRAQSSTPKMEKMFTLKKWNAVAMWSWDVECDTCAICRVQVMGKFFRLGSVSSVACFGVK